MAEAGALADTAAVVRANGGYNYGYPAPMYGGYGMGGFGMDGSWIWIIALLAMCGGLGGFGMGGFGGLGGLGMDGLGGGLIGYGMGMNAYPEIFKRLCRNRRYNSACNFT